MESQFSDLKLTWAMVGGSTAIAHIPKLCSVVVPPDANGGTASYSKEVLSCSFQAIINDPFMLNSVVLVFANKQDMRGAMTPVEVCEGLGLYDLKNRVWHIQGTCALRGDGLYEGLDWLASTLKELEASGRATSVGTSSS
ncbi:hypothetical protein BHM03_00018081 [Ensete ventricosum]|nr:hypothetical protein BHM03_00018081 [Ensete ventricosum]